MCINPYLTIKVNNVVLSFKDIARMKRYSGMSLYEMTNSKDIVEINCGKCAECLKKKFIELKQRIKNEFKKNKICYFVTLTYDDEHRKKLNKRDFQLFAKRYRKKHKMRYFYVGELGETTQREHYHAIIFDHIPNDLEETKNKTKSGYVQYNSKEIQNIWQNGLITICKMTNELIGYILKYMFKYQDDKNFVYGWSTKPPIGINTETIEKDILKRNRTRAEVQYYKNHYKKIVPEIESLKEDKNIKIEQIEKQTKMTYLNYIKQKRQDKK